jgi:hypothetical protein
MSVTFTIFWTGLALFVAAGTFFSLLLVVRSMARQSMGLALPVALAVFVCFETAVVNVLSLFDAVTQIGLLIPHLALISACLAWRRMAARNLAASISRRFRPRLDIRTLVMAPLLVLVLASALRYPPNNGDSMEYRLARVAHWIQNQSIESYPTSSLRQTAMAPGAEYLVLLVQGISGSDRLAAIVQFTSFLLVIVAAPVLARMAGAPKTVATFGAPLVACLPGGLLQASSTQNDAVAAAVTIAIVATSIPFLRRRTRRDVVPRVILVALCVSAAVLVKATALFAAIPIVVLALCQSLASVGRASRRALQVGAVACAACLALAIVSIESRRAVALARAPAAVAEFTYAWSEGAGERAKNALRGMARNLSFPHALRPAIEPFPEPVAHMALAGQFGPLVPQEDVAGNPLHAALAIVALGAAASWARAMPRRALWAAACVAVAWVLHHAFFRDNAYASRLQVPLFGIWPMLLGVLGAHPLRRAQSVVIKGVRTVTFVAFVIALPMVLRNHSRPPLARDAGPVAEAYYRTIGAERAREAQLRTLRIASEGRCRRLALFMGESGWDYPITWQAMRAGIEVRHLVELDDWPCLIYYEPGSWEPWGVPQKTIALNPAQWIPAEPYHGMNFLFIRRDQ